MSRLRIVAIVLTLVIAASATSVHAILLPDPFGFLEPSTGVVFITTAPFDVCCGVPPFQLAPHIHLEPLVGVWFGEPPHAAPGYLDVTMFGDAIGDAFKLTGHFVSPYVGPIDLIGEGELQFRHENVLALVLGRSVPEPSTGVLFLVALGCLGLIWRVRPDRSPLVRT